MIIFNKQGKASGKILSGTTLARGNFTSEVLDEQLTLITAAKKQKGISKKATKFLLNSEHAIQTRKADAVKNPVEETVSLTAAEVKKQVDAGIAEAIKAMKTQAASTAEVPSTPAVPSVPEAPIDYDSATVADLKVLATSKGLTFSGKITKVEIVELLKNAAE